MNRRDKFRETLDLDWSDIVAEVTEADALQNLPKRKDYGPSWNGTAEGDVHDQAGIQDTDYPYFHVSDHPEKPSIYTEQRMGSGRAEVDPFGIYLFPKNTEIGMGGWDEKKYRWDAKLKPNARIFDLNDGNVEALARDAGATLKSVLSGAKFPLSFYKKRIDELMEEIERAIKPSPAWEGRDLSNLRITLISMLDMADAGHRDLYQEQLEPVYKAWHEWFDINENSWGALVAHFHDPKKLTEYLKQKYDVMRDREGQTVLWGEPQLIVLNPKVIDWLKRETNEVDKDVYKLSSRVAEAAGILPERLEEYIMGEESFPTPKELEPYRKTLQKELKALYPSRYAKLYRGLAYPAAPHEIGEIFTDADVLISFTESKATAISIAKQRAEDYDEYGYAIEIEVPTDAIYFHWKLDPIGKEHPKEKEVLINPYSYEWKVIKAFAPGGENIKVASATEIESRKAVGILYHFTTPDGMQNIIEDNWKLRTVNREQISFTRNPNLDFHANVDTQDDDGEFTGNHIDVKTTYRIAIDGDKLTDKYKLEPFTDRGQFTRQGKPEAEEIIRKTEVDLNGCVIRVDHLMDFSYEKEYSEGLKYLDDIADSLDVGEDVHTFYPLIAAVNDTYTADQLIDQWGKANSYENLAKAFRSEGEDLASMVPHAIDRYAEYKETEVDPKDIAPNGTTAWTDPLTMLDSEDEKWAQKYAKMDPKTAPPVILQPDKTGFKWKVVDGRHRIRAAVIRGSKVKAVIPVEKSKRAEGNVPTLTAEDVLKAHEKFTTMAVQPHVRETILSHPEWELKEMMLSDFNERHTVESLVEKYVKLYEHTKKFPPVIAVLADNGDYELLDGAHRVEAARRLGLEEIEAYVPIEANRAEAGGFYAWDDQDGPLYIDPPLENKGDDQRTMPKQSMDWPSLRLEAAGPKIKSADQIVEYVKSIHLRDDWEDTDLEERIYEAASKYELKEIPVKDIETDQFNIDTEFVNNELKEKDIKANPVVLERGLDWDHDGFYLVIDGAHRVDKALALGLNKIPAWVPVVNKKSKAEAKASNAFLSKVETLINSPKFKTALKRDLDAEHREDFDFDDYFPARKQEILRDLNRGAKVNGSKITLWRAYGFKSNTDLKFKGFMTGLKTGEASRGLGESWSYLEGAAYPWSGNTEGFKCLLKAEVPIASIDFYSTLMRLFDTGYGDTEQEIVVDSGKDVIPLELSEWGASGKLIWKADKPKKMAADLKTEAKKIFESSDTDPYLEIWRVQNDKGEGPYAGLDNEEWSEDSHADSPSHPNVGDDPGFNESDRKEFHEKTAERGNVLFGFRTIDELKQWFSPVELENLKWLGFLPVRRKAANVWDSGKQVFFEPYGVITAGLGRTSWPKTMTNQELAVHWDDMAYGDYREPGEGGSDGEIEEALDRIKNNWEDDTIWTLKTLNVSDVEGHHSGHDKSTEYVEEYEARKAKGSEFPPLIVEPDEDSPGKYKTIDGQHRLFAAKKLGEKTIRAYVPDAVSEASLIEAAVGIGDLERMARPYLKQFFDDMPMPEFKISNTLKVKWLGRCSYSATHTVPVVQIQKAILNDPPTLERTLAHELVHAWNYLFTPEQVAFYKFSREHLGKKVDRYSDIAREYLRLQRQAKINHGKAFLDKAAEINQVKGKDFVTVTSDERDVIEDTGKEFFVLVEKTEKGPYGWNSFSKKTPHMREAIKYRQEKFGAKLFRVNDQSLVAQKSLKLYAGVYVPIDAHKQKKLRDLYESGTPVTADMETEAASDKWKELGLKLTGKLKDIFGVETGGYAYYYVNAHLPDGTRVGYVEISIAKDKGVYYGIPHGTDVPAQYRRLGIASAMYDYAEENCPLKPFQLDPDAEQSPEAEKLWKDRLAGKPIKVAAVAEKVFKNGEYMLHKDPMDPLDLKNWSDEEIAHWIDVNIYDLDGYDSLKLAKAFRTEIYNPVASKSQITIYRMLNHIDSLDKVRTEGFGLSWAFDDRENDYVKGNRNNKGHLFKGQVSPNDIDWGITLMAFINWPEQNECRLNKGAKVHITHVNNEPYDKQVTAEETEASPDRTSLSRAMSWLVRYLYDVEFEPKLRKLPSDKIVQALKPFRPKKPLTLYRGLGEKASLTEYTDNNISSWSENINVAKKFAGKKGTILKTRVSPEHCLVDVDRIGSEKALTDEGYSLDDLNALRPERIQYPEAEIILLPGTYKVRTVAKAEAVEAELQFMSAPAIWNGRSEIVAGVRVTNRTYVCKKDLKTFIDTYVNIPDADLKTQIDAAMTDDDIPEAFYQQNQDMVYFNDLVFRTYRLNDMLYQTIIEALLARRPLPQNIRVVLFSPARDKSYLVKDILQKGEHLLQSSLEEPDETEN